MKNYNMPWLMVRHGSREEDSLKQRYGSTGIPFPAIIDDEGEVISRKGRSEISSRGAGAFRYWK